MKMVHSPLSFVVAISSVFASAAPTTAYNVLTPQNFEDTISQGVWFIEHFSPYCRHCRNFEPTWNDVVDHFESMPDPGVHLAQVNCALNGDLCNQNGVSGYPQMNLYRNGEFVETYNADRDFQPLVEFLRNHAEHEEASATEEDASSSVPEPTEQEPEPTPTPTPSTIVAPIPTHSDANPSGTVVPLDVQAFDNFLAQGPAFIKFFAPWCGHCKKLAPAWSMLGRRMQHKLNVAEVDCEQHKALCTSQGVTGFPMMFYYAHGVKTEYTGGRSYDQLVSFADRASNPSMQVIEAPELEGVARENAVLYLLLHDTSNDHIVNDIIKGSQFLLGSPPVYVSTSSELFRQYKLPPNTPSALLAFKDKDVREPVAVFYPSSTSQSAETLKTWLLVNRFPSSFELSKDVFPQVMYAPHKPLVVIVATPQGQEGKVSDKLHEIAQKWRLRVRAGRTADPVGLGGKGVGAREVLFTWVDMKQWGKWMKDMYAIKAGTEPKIIVADHEQLVYYDRDGSGNHILLNSLSVASALEAILGGTARPKQSQNILQRAVRSLNDALVWLQDAITAHPYITVLAVLGLIGAVFTALRSLLAEEAMTWETEKRPVKGARRLD